MGRQNRMTRTAMKKGAGLLFALALVMIISAFSAAAVFAEDGEAGNETLTVYVTITNDSDFVRGTEGTVMAHVPVKVSYFGLADYGLSDYCRLDEEDNPIKRPTVLHLLIRTLETYYARRTLTAEDMHSDIIDVTGAPKSLWLNRIWGHDGNLLYFVNHSYPLMASKWGATADYILLEDQDEIDMAMFTDWSFYNNSAFMFFESSTATAKAGKSLRLKLLAKPTSVVNDGVDRGSFPMEGEQVRVSSDFGVTWTDTEQKTGADGTVTLTFDAPGTYYVASGPAHANYKDASPAVCIVTVTEAGSDDQGGGSDSPGGGSGGDPGDDPGSDDAAVTEAKAELTAAIDAAKALAASDYTAESYQLLQEAVEKAESLAADTAATADDLRAALDAIETAKAGLVPADPQGEDDPGTTYVVAKKVRRLEAGAFAGSPVTTLIVKTKRLTKASVKGSLTGSSVETIKVKVGGKKINKKYVKKYKKIFTKKNAGKKVTVQ